MLSAYLYVQLQSTRLKAPSTVSATAPVGNETEDYYSEETPTAVSYSSEEVTVMQYLADTNTTKLIHSNYKPSNHSNVICVMKHLVAVAVSSDTHSFIQLKGHVCEICNKRFRESNSLMKHVCIHSGDKSFKCV